MSARPKYLFETDFGAPKPAEPEMPAVPLSKHLDEVKRMGEAAYQRGLADGRQQALTDDAARLSAAMQRLTQGFAEASAEFAALAGHAEQQAAILAVAFARKLAGALIERQPVVQIEALARSVFAHLRATPHAVVRVNDRLVEAVKLRLDRIAEESGFTGRIVVLGEPETAMGDARIEWADGGAVRDGAALDAALDDVVRRYLAATTRREDQEP